jgi:hypothetical protein
MDWRNIRQAPLRSNNQLNNQMDKALAFHHENEPLGNIKTVENSQLKEAFDTAKHDEGTDTSSKHYQLKNGFTRANYELELCAAVHADNKVKLDSCQQGATHKLCNKYASLLQVCV